MIAAPLALQATSIVGIPTLWAPILVAAVLVFIASALAWTVLPHHKADWVAVPDEDDIMKGLRHHSIAPGHYMFPFAKDMDAFKGESHQQQLDEGPVGLMIVQTADARRNMGPMLLKSFVFYLIISAIVAYVAGRTIPAGAEYLTVFRLTGTVAFLAYVGGMIPDAIWFGKSWSSTWKSVADGLVYGLLTAGAFGWLWPGM